MAGNAEILRRGVEAFNARDIDRLVEFFDPETEMHSAFAQVDGGVYRGHDGLRAWHRDLEETWDEIRLDPEELVERDDEVLAYYAMHGRGSQSGVDVAMRVAHHVRLRDGLIVYLKTYDDLDAARRDFG